MVLRCRVTYAKLSAECHFRRQQKLSKLALDWYDTQARKFIRYLPGLSFFDYLTFTEKQMRLKGKTALVTAAGQGIGYASVMAMVAEGATVWATDINPTLLERFKGHDTIHTHVLDVMDKAAIKAFAAKFLRSMFYSTVQASSMQAPY